MPLDVQWRVQRLYVSIEHVQRTPFNSSPTRCFEANYYAMMHFRCFGFNTCNDHSMMENNWTARWPFPPLPSAVGFFQHESLSCQFQSAKPWTHEHIAYFLRKPTRSKRFLSHGSCDFFYQQSACLNFFCLDVSDELCFVWLDLFASCLYKPEHMVWIQVWRGTSSETNIFLSFVTESVCERGLNNFFRSSACSCQDQCGSTRSWSWFWGKSEVWSFSSQAWSSPLLAQCLGEAADKGNGMANPKLWQLLLYFIRFLSSQKPAKNLKDKGDALWLTLLWLHVLCKRLSLSTELFQILNTCQRVNMQNIKVDKKHSQGGILAPAKLIFLCQRIIRYPDVVKLSLLTGHVQHSLVMFCFVDFSLLSITDPFSFSCGQDCRDSGVPCESGKAKSKTNQMLPSQQIAWATSWWF